VEGTQLDLSAGQWAGQTPPGGRVLAAFSRLLDGLEWMLKVVLGTCMAVMACTLILQVILRYFFASSLDAGWEIARLSFVSALLLGIPVAQRSGLHVGIELAGMVASAGVKRLISVVRELLVVLLFLVLIDKSLVLYAIASDEMLHTINISKGVFYMAQIAAAGMCIVFGIEAIFYKLAGRERVRTQAKPPKAKAEIKADSKQGECR